MWEISIGCPVRCSRSRWKSYKRWELSRHDSFLNSASFMSSLVLLRIYTKLFCTYIIGQTMIIACEQVALTVDVLAYPGSEDSLREYYDKILLYYT